MLDMLWIVNRYFRLVALRALGRRVAVIFFMQAGKNVLFPVHSNYISISIKETNI